MLVRSCKFRMLQDSCKVLLPYRMLQDSCKVLTTVLETVFWLKIVELCELCIVKRLVFSSKLLIFVSYASSKVSQVEKSNSGNGSWKSNKSNSENGSWFLRKIQLPTIRKWKLEIQQIQLENVFFGIVGFPTIQISKMFFSDCRISNNPTSSAFNPFDNLSDELAFLIEDMGDVSNFGISHWFAGLQ